MRSFLASVAIAAVLAGCGGAPVEPGLFFPTWEPENGVPGAIVSGTLVEDDRCLYLDNGTRSLVVWEAGMGFEDGALLDGSGSPIARLGETIHGGGGYYGDLGHIERLSGDPIPERCIPEARNGDEFAIIYGVEAGPFE
ncbi:MAG TPA: hypothetical protein VFP13_04050 [Actinomycetota bacterium]|nr:hypothetical protein [Actinomycetota bacterium]